MKYRIRSKLSAAPGGRFFYERDGRRVEAGTYDSAVQAVARLLAERGVAADAEEELAAYMCPRVGRDALWFCAGGEPVSAGVPPRDALENSLRAVAGRLVATFDTIESRLATCQRCPKHERNWCPTCTGHFDRVMVSLSRKRPRLPLDRGAGVCACAKAYESAICSVEYGKDESAWEGTPEGCWRRKDV